MSNLKIIENNREIEVVCDELTIMSFKINFFSKNGKQEAKQKALAFCQNPKYSEFSHNVEGLLITKEGVEALSELITIAKNKQKAEKAKVSRQANALKKWAKDLAYYTGEDENTCLKIAKEKLRYDGKMPSPIKDDGKHADNIIKAYKRHTQSGYEAKLEEAKEKAKNGEIEYSEIRSWARENKYESSY